MNGKTKGRVPAQRGHKAGIWLRYASQSGLVAFVLASSGFAEAAPKECINYYTVGESSCEATPQPAVAPSAPELLAPQAEVSEEVKVDEFLANYGKPPREFVQFYMNPTADNARKWVEAYQQIMQKSQNISQMWADAERLYQQPEAKVPPRRVAPALGAAAAVQPVAATSPSLPVTQASPMANFGALTGVQSLPKAGGILPQESPLKVTYYFSQVCPFCARMTPELSVITKNYAGKLEFTCVDVTPFSGAVAPNPAYLRDKLACQWRLPQADELQREGVAQTPTLLIQPFGKPQVKLSGYMSPAQLQPYFAR